MCCRKSCRLVACHVFGNVMYLGMSCIWACHVFGNVMYLGTSLSRDPLWVWQSLHRGNRTEPPNETERTPSTRPQRWFWEIIHCQALPHQGPPNRLRGSPTHHTYQLMAYQMHQRGHQNIQARHCSTGHQFLHQRYLATPATHRRIFYIQNPQPNPDWGISNILRKPPSLPLCWSTTDWFSEHTLLSPTLIGSKSYQFPACAPHRTNPPISSLRVIFQQSTKAAAPSRVRILLKTIRAYSSKRPVVISSFFRTKYYWIENLTWCHRGEQTPETFFGALMC